MRSYLVFFPIVLALSCSRLFTTEIKDILDHPREYDGKTVTIKGEVIQSVNLAVLKYYTVKDQTGEIYVVAERAVPREGEKVRVTGEVKQAFAIGNKNLVVIVEEKE